MSKSKTNESKCYICDKSIFRNGTNLFTGKTFHSKTSIHELLQKAIGRSLVKTAETSLGCPQCIQKLNKYDMACITTSSIEKELVQMINRTEKNCAENVVLLYDVEKSDNNIVKLEDGITYIIKNEQTSNSDKLNEQEDLDEYELHFFASDGETQEGGDTEDITTQSPEYQIVYESYENEKTNKDSEIIKEEIQLTEETEMVEQKSSVKENTPSKQKRRNGKSTSTCEHCKKEFPSVQALRTHRRQNHDGERLVCDICGISYKTRTALNIHVGMHKGFSPFECEVCGKKFTQKGALKRHRPMHTGEKPYQCEKCGKQFIHYSSFHMHNLAHDDVRNKKCDICGLQLRSSSHLKRHMLVHTGQKPHACPKCGQRFAQRYNMMSHFRSHQGIHRKKKHEPKKVKGRSTNPYNSNDEVYYEQIIITEANNDEIISNESVTTEILP